MKQILFIMAVWGISATAATASNDCTHADWTVISAALNSQANAGEEYRGQVLGMLAEEMGPVCKNVTSFGAGIPGNEYYSYELTSGARRFHLDIVVGGVEQPGTRLAIEKK